MDGKSAVITTSERSIGKSCPVRWQPPASRAFGVGNTKARPACAGLALQMGSFSKTRRDYFDMPVEAGGAGVGAGLAQAPKLRATAASAMIARYFIIGGFPSFLCQWA